MIAGHVSIEDVSIVFHITHAPADGGEPVARYTACLSATGEEETRTVPARDFMAALSLALLLDGDFPQNSRAAWQAAESAQPANANLRFIP